MIPEDAEEYTQALGQVVAGSWRQVALGKRLGVPQALGISTETWVEDRLGGYVRLGISERREAVKELTAPIEDGGAGMSMRDAAEVLGVDPMTVVRDRRSVANATDHPPDDEQVERTSVANATPEPDSDIGEDLEPADAVFDSPFQRQAPFEMPELEEPSPEERSFSALSRATMIVRLDPVAVAEAGLAIHPIEHLDSYVAYMAWLERFIAHMRERIAQPIRSVK